MKQSKTNDVLNHLIVYGSITSLEAFKRYGLTRLSSVIFELRKKHNIETIMLTTKDRHNITVNYAKYIYKGVLDE